MSLEGSGLGDPPWKAGPRSRAGNHGKARAVTGFHAGSGLSPRPDPPPAPAESSAPGAAEGESLPSRRLACQDRFRLSHSPRHARKPEISSAPIFRCSGTPWSGRAFAWVKSGWRGFRRNRGHPGSGTPPVGSTSSRKATGAGQPSALHGSIIKMRTDPGSPARFGAGYT